MDVDDLLRDIAETRRRTAIFETAFASHPGMQLEYEGLAADPQDACGRVFSFLGVSPFQVQVPTAKIVRTSPEALVVNFDEVQAALREAGEA